MPGAGGGRGSSRAAKDPGSAVKPDPEDAGGAHGQPAVAAVPVVVPIRGSLVPVSKRASAPSSSALEAVAASLSAAAATGAGAGAGAAAPHSSSARRTSGTAAAGAAALPAPEPAPAAPASAAAAAAAAIAAAVAAMRAKPALVSNAAAAAALVLDGEGEGNWPPRASRAADAALAPVVLPFGLDAPAAARHGAGAGAGAALDDDEVVVVGHKKRGAGQHGAGAIKSGGAGAGAGAGGAAPAVPAVPVASLDLPPAAPFTGGIAEGSLLHITLPATLPLRHLATHPAPRAGAGAGAGAGAHPQQPPAQFVLPPLDDETDPSEPYRARMRAIPEGQLGKVRCGFVRLGPPVGRLGVSRLPAGASLATNFRLFPPICLSSSALSLPALALPPQTSLLRSSASTPRAA
jgi:hypothetical protein